MISNPNSTSVDDATLRRVVPPLLAVPGMRLLSRFTAAPGHAGEMVRGLTAAEVDAVIVVGGDGTVNEVINGLLADLGAEGAPDPGALPALAVVPAGSANVLAGALGMPREPGAAAERLAGLLHSGVERRITLGRAGDRWFAVNAGLGIDGEVIHAMERLRARGVSANPARYAPTVLGAWWRMRRDTPRIRCTVDGRDLGGELPVVVASNTNPWTFFGQLPVVTNPGTTLDSGLGVWAVRSIAGVRGLAAVARLVGGVPRRHDPLRVAGLVRSADDAARVTLSSPRPLRFQVDGDYAGLRDRVELRAAPAALRMVAPPPGRDFSAEGRRGSRWAHAAAAARRSAAGLRRRLRSWPHPG